MIKPTISTIMLLVGTMIFLLASVTKAEAAHGTFNVRNFGATGDGTTDDQTAIQNALNAAANGGTCYFPAGNYLHSGVLFATNCNILGVGTASNLIANHVAATALKLSVSGTVKSIKFSSNLVDPFFKLSNESSGLWIDSATNFTVEGVTIQPLFQTSLNIKHCNRGVVTGNRISIFNTREAMSLIDTRDITISSNSISAADNNFGEGIDVGFGLTSPNFFDTSPNQRIIVQNNTFTGFGSAVAFFGGTDCSITSNTIQQTQDPIFAEASAPNVINPLQNLVIANNRLDGAFTAVTVINFRSQDPNILRNVTVQGNLITNSVNLGILAYGPENGINILNNTIQNITTTFALGGVGISVGDTRDGNPVSLPQNVAVVGNNISNAQGFGITFGRDGLPAVVPGASFRIESNKISNINTLHTPGTDVIFVGPGVSPAKIQLNSYTGNTTGVDFFIRSIPQSFVRGNVTNTLLPSKIGP